jgi:DNA-binding NtrC family response regulator
MPVTRRTLSGEVFETNLFGLSTARSKISCSMQGLQRRLNMKPRVLVADDEEMFLEYLSRRLRKSQYEVTTCLSGEEVLEKIKDYDFDVVILDVLMPGIDGIETLGEIKRIRPLTEVIMLSGHASLESGIEGMRLGAFDYLRKPCDTEELISKIDKAYERKAEQEERIRVTSEHYNIEPKPD